MSWWTGSSYSYLPSGIFLGKTLLKNKILKKGKSKIVFLSSFSQILLPLVFFFFGLFNVAAWIIFVKEIWTPYNMTRTWYFINQSCYLAAPQWMHLKMLWERKGGSKGKGKRSCFYRSSNIMEIKHSYH